MRYMAERVIAQLVSAHRHGIPLILLFDYDGTLAPIAARPELAVLPPGTRQTLARLMHLAKVEIGVLSARQLDDLRAVLALPGPYLAGASGMELDLHGTRVEHPRAAEAAAMMTQLADHLSAAIAAYPGVWIENKRLALTIHYRQLLARSIDSLRASVARVSKAFGGDVRIVQGPQAWDFMPRWGWTKGSAMRLILAEVGVCDAAVLYAGDGANDADAMDMTTAVGGFALGIGDEAPAAAQYRLSGPAELTAFLDSLATTLEHRSHAPHSVRSGLLTTR